MIRKDIMKEMQHALQNNSYGYIDKNTFSFEFGEGVFTDEDGNPCFYHIEYHIDTNTWVFQKWYEDEVCDANLPASEENYIIAVVKELM